MKDIAGQVRKSAKKKIFAGISVILLPILVFFMIILISFWAIFDDEEQNEKIKRLNEADTEEQCKDTGKMKGITFGGQMDIILQTIRIVESSENYTDPPNDPPKATASGAYQFIASTWKGYKDIWGPYGDFTYAYQAQPSVQDMVAKKKVEDIIAANPVDVVGPTWLLGHVPKGDEWNVKIGKNPTPRQYQAKWMKVYTFLVEAAKNGGQGGGITTPDAAERNSTFFKAKANPGDTVNIGDTYSGFASTYGNDPTTGYVDTGDNNIPALSGASNNAPGVAVYNQGTLGGWWQVTAPNGRTVTLQQTDYGPSTSRMIDINAVAARSAFGYPAKDFPTDQGNWTAKYLGKDKPEGALTADTGGTGDSETDKVTIEEATCNIDPNGLGDNGGNNTDVKIPDGAANPEDIVTVEGYRVHKDIATNFGNMIKAMRAAGLKPGGGAYRDAAGQIAARRRNCGSSNYAIYQQPAGSCRPPTAKPGTSMHEKGMAVDFTCAGVGSYAFRGTPCMSWLRINAAGYGFINLASEPWHWSTNGR